jgi:hypothetical protein
LESGFEFEFKTMREAFDDLERSAIK